MLKVNELFVSLQGESTHAGRLCAFIRLGGCNLKCSYCDTLYAQSEDSGKPYGIDDLVKFARESHSTLVEITGGEPLLYAEVPLLTKALIDAGFTVLIETNGSLPTRHLPEQTRIILDVKLPSSGMAKHNLAENYARLRQHDEVKFVIGDRKDYEFAKKVIAEHELEKRTPNLLAGPVWGKIAFDKLASWLIADRSPMRMQLQMHKFIWDAEKRGV